MTLTAWRRLLRLSPMDGRYAGLTADLQPYLSEAALIWTRVFVQVEWLKTLSTLKLPEFPALGPDSLSALDAIVGGFSPEELLAVKAHEAVTKHDVKAVEYYLRNKFAASGGRLHTLSHFLHFGCTSEDVSSVAYAVLVNGAREQVVGPWQEKVHGAVRARAHEWATAVIPGRTHGQLGTPTTLGKEMGNYARRLQGAAEAVGRVKARAKFSGAVGNWNAHVVCYPTVDWVAVSGRFVSGFGVEFNQYTTQIEPHDWLAELCHALHRYNTVLTDMNQNIWGYVSHQHLRVLPVAAETGSSTMPHKVNPIDFENAEGNLGVANAMLGHMAAKLPASRFQRDLTDSTVLRNLGSTLGHCLVAYKGTVAGLEKLAVVPCFLDDQWLLLAEPLQMCLRKAGCLDAYERVKDWTRGKSHVSRSEYLDFVTRRCPELLEADRAVLLQLTPNEYIGLAAHLARHA